MRDKLIVRIIQLGEACDIDIPGLGDSIDLGTDLSDGKLYDTLGELDDESLLGLFEETLRTSLK